MTSLGGLRPYSMAQTVFMLSLASNALFGISADTAVLQTSIEEYLGTPGGAAGSFFSLLNQPSAEYPCLAGSSAATPGDWATAWGPVVFQALENPGATN